MKEKTLIILLSLVLLVCAGAMVYLLSNSPASQMQQPAGKVKTVSSVGGPFEMVNQDGEAVTEADFKGQYTLMFFGFTHCPGICPGELTKISTVLDLLEEEGKAGKVTPVFISVDPARDTPEVMKEYIEVYDSRLIGLTGSQEQVNAMKDTYKVHASKIEMEMMDPGEYMMDHSTFTYLMSPENELLLVFDVKDEPEEIVKEMASVF